MTLVLVRVVPWPQSFVVEGDTARLRKVETGVAAGDLVEIISGLKPGEKYVTRGAFNLREGDKVAVAGAAQQGKE